MSNDDDKFWGWLLLGVLGSFGLVKAIEWSSVEERMKRAIMSQARLPEVRRRAAELIRGCRMDEICRVERIYRFVADQVDYMPDPWNEEHFAEALETIYVGAGDCDCKCILLATLLRANGFRVALDFIPGHVLVEAHVSASFVAQIPPGGYVRPDPTTGGGWILLESTGAGAQIGWVSDEVYHQYLARGEERRVEI